MNRKRDSEVPIEERFVRNSGHGPPNYSATSLMQSPATTFGFGFGFGGSNGIKQQMPQRAFSPTSQQHQSVSKFPNASDDTILRSHVFAIGHHVKENSRSERNLMEITKEDFWKNRCEHLEKEIQELRIHDQMLETVVNKLQEIKEIPSSRRKSEHEFLELAATVELLEDANSKHKMLPSPKEDEGEMMKSIQCSEVSYHEPDPLEKTEVAKEGLHKGSSGQVSKSSSTSFEIIKNESCMQSPSYEPVLDTNRSEVRMLPSHDFDLMKRIESLQIEVENLKRRDETLGLIREEQSALQEEVAKLKRKLEEVHKEKQSHCESTLQGELFDKDRLIEGLRKRNTELMDANRALAENLLQLTHENKELKEKRECEKIQRSQFLTDTDKAELEKARKVATEAEEELARKSRQIRDMEDRWRQSEAACYPVVSSIQAGSHDLVSENAILKHQIQAYKEDFDNERADREKLVAEKDTLQRCYDTIRAELDVARQQVRKYEDDISKLRIDNSNFRDQLRQVTDQLEMQKTRNESGRRAIVASASHAAPPSQDYTLAPYLRLTTFQNPLPSQIQTSAASSMTEWGCRTCTFKNKAQSTFCEMCGSTAISGSPEASSGACYMPNIPSHHQSEPRMWATVSSPRPMPPLLSNRRNCGDIESD